MLVLVQLLRVGQAGAWAVLLSVGRCYRPAGEPTVRQRSFPLKISEAQPLLHLVCVWEITTRVVIVCN